MKCIVWMQLWLHSVEYNIKKMCSKCDEKNSKEKKNCAVQLNKY